MIELLIGWITGFASAIVAGMIISRNKKEEYRKKKLDQVFGRR